MWETLKGDSYPIPFDIDAEIDLARRKSNELQADRNLTPQDRKQAMKDLGIERYLFKTG